jgi:hypothetical protein
MTLGIDINTAAWGVIAVVNLATAYLTWRVNHAVKTVKRDVIAIEKATNGMKAELVEATAKASFIEGRVAGREQATTTAAQLATKVAAAAAAAADIKSTPPE